MTHDLGVETLGHAVRVWWEASHHFIGRVERAQNSPSGTAILPVWASLGNPPLLFTDQLSSFSLTLEWNSDRRWLSGVSTLKPTAFLWLTWLLHLPALRETWSRELRANRFERLLALCPRSWYDDGTAVPPGAVIRGGNWTNWQEARALISRAESVPSHPADPKWIVENLRSTDVVLSHYEVESDGKVEWRGAELLH